MVQNTGEEGNFLLLVQARAPIEGNRLPKSHQVVRRFACNDPWNSAVIEE